LHPSASSSFLEVHNPSCPLQGAVFLHGADPTSSCLTVKRGMYTPRKLCPSVMSNQVVGRNMRGVGMKTFVVAQFRSLKSTL
jgi:hypothetical protein